MNQQVRIAKHHLPSLDDILTLELVRVTERAAVAAARLRGRGDELTADQAACGAMHRNLKRLAIAGKVVIGAGERDATPKLYVGERVGTKKGPKVDLALDPLEGATLAAKNMPNALSVIAIAAEGNLLPVPNIYMQKIAIGPGYAPGLVDLDAPAADNIQALAEAKGVSADEITVCLLDRPRHAQLIEEVRATGAAIRLIGDGDVAGVIQVAESKKTGIDIYLGIGGAPQGVLAAAALRCIGGQMQGRLVTGSAEQRERAERMGLDDLDRKFDVADMARGDVLFSATGVTGGDLLAGVRFGRRAITTHTVVMRSSTGTVRWIRADHQNFDKFDAAA
jgi:fructose-1,6-bisphosphatase II / sedoheptulose-1,7-bisphosphatase